jgi:SAM-dependent methyltransferase
MGDRKLEESQFHDMLRSAELRQDSELYRIYTANKKFYSINRKSRKFFDDWLIKNCAGRRVLDYGCGDGRYAILAARHGAQAVGVDVSAVSVENARAEAAREGLADRTAFHVMDGEALEFADDSFDIVCEAGVLHHLDLGRAMAEIIRVLSPSGQVICAEALGHNPLFQAYRRLTPHLRTPWETNHIVRRRDILDSARRFRRCELRFFHLASLAAVLLRGTRAFDTVLSALERVDDVLMRLPAIRWYAWQIVYVLSAPIKARRETP